MALATSKSIGSKYSKSNSDVNDNAKVLPEVSDNKNIPKAITELAKVSPTEAALKSGNDEAVVALSTKDIGSTTVSGARARVRKLVVELASAIKICRILEERELCSGSEDMKTSVSVTGAMKSDDMKIIHENPNLTEGLNNGDDQSVQSVVHIPPESAKSAQSVMDTKQKEENTDRMSSKVASEESPKSNLSLLEEMMSDAARSPPEAPGFIPPHLRPPPKKLSTEVSAEPSKASHGGKDMSSLQKHSAVDTITPSKSSSVEKNVSVGKTSAVAVEKTSTKSSGHESKISSSSPDGSGSHSHGVPLTMPLNEASKPEESTIVHYVEANGLGSNSGEVSKKLEELKATGSAFQTRTVPPYHRGMASSSGSGTLSTKTSIQSDDGTKSNNVPPHLRGIKGANFPSASAKAPFPAKIVAPAGPKTVAHLEPKVVANVPSVHAKNGNVKTTSSAEKGKDLAISDSLTRVDTEKENSRHSSRSHMQRLTNDNQQAKSTCATSNKQAKNTCATTVISKQDTSVRVAQSPTNEQKPGDASTWSVNPKQDVSVKVAKSPTNEQKSGNAAIELKAKLDAEQTSGAPAVKQISQKLFANNTNTATYTNPSDGSKESAWVPPHLRGIPPSPDIGTTTKTSEKRSGKQAVGVADKGPGNAMAQGLNSTSGHPFVKEAPDLIDFENDNMTIVQVKPKAPNQQKVVTWAGVGNTQDHTDASNSVFNYAFDGKNLPPGVTMDPYDSRMVYIHTPLPHLPNLTGSVPAKRALTGIDCNMFKEQNEKLKHLPTMMSQLDKLLPPSLRNVPNPVFRGKQLREEKAAREKARLDAQNIDTEAEARKKELAKQKHEKRLKELRARAAEVRRAAGMPEIGEYRYPENAALAKRLDQEHAQSATGSECAQVKNTHATDADQALVIPEDDAKVEAPNMVNNVKYLTSHTLRKFVTECNFNRFGQGQASSLAADIVEGRSSPNRRISYDGRGSFDPWTCEQMFEYNKRAPKFMLDDHPDILIDLEVYNREDHGGTPRWVRDNDSLVADEILEEDMVRTEEKPSNTDVYVWRWFSRRDDSEAGMMAGRKLTAKDESERDKVPVHQLSKKWDAGYKLMDPWHSETIAFEHGHEKVGGIERWLKYILVGAKKRPYYVDTTTTSFRSGKEPVHGMRRTYDCYPPWCLAPRREPQFGSIDWDNIPTLPPPDDFSKHPIRRLQTAELCCKIANEQMEKGIKEAKIQQQKREEQIVRMREEYDERISNLHDPFKADTKEGNTWLPAANMYVRAAKAEEDAQIREFYNYWASHTVHTVELAAVPEGHFAEIIKRCADTSNPCLVAVSKNTSRRYCKKGGFNTRKQNPDRSDRTRPGWQETILGIAWVQEVAPAHTIMRGMGEAYIYVHPDWTNKGVGKNLFDRLMPLLDPGYQCHYGSDLVVKQEDLCLRTAGIANKKKILFTLYLTKDNKSEFDFKRKFLEKHGFHVAGWYHNAGAKFDKPITMVTMMKEALSRSTNDSTIYPGEICFPEGVFREP